MSARNSRPDEVPDEEGLPLVSSQQEPRVQILRSLSTTSAGMSSPTRAFRNQSITEADTLEVEPEGAVRDVQDHWDKPIQFLLSCIAMSVGLGNVWRFPFVLFKNGGGAFLIPYLLVLLLFGRPLYLLELGIGQFSSKGAAPMWDMVPAFRGIGYAQAVAIFLVLSYYTIIICIALFYLVVSFNPTLPWTVCSSLAAVNETFLKENKTCVPSGASTEDFANPDNLTVAFSSPQYFDRVVMNTKSDITDGIGVPNSTLMAALTVVWFLFYVCMRSGLRGQGKVSYFTAIVPYVILLTMLVQGLTLEGSWNGIRILFKTDFSKLKEIQVWYAAITQSLYSLTIGCGCLGTFAKYNNFSHPTSRDALIISFADCFTSILAGTVIFAVLGHLAFLRGTPDDLSSLADGGFGFVFQIYPEVLASFPVNNLFAVLFFLMLVTLGFGSGIGLLVTITTTAYEAIPAVKDKTLLKMICTLGLAIGLFYATPGGIAVLTVADDAFERIILGLACLEVVAVSWVYGTSNIMRDLNFMLDTKLNIYWRFCWGVFCPVILPVIFVYMIVGIKLSGSNEVAHWFTVLLIAAILAIVPGHFLYTLCQHQEGKRWWTRMFSCARSPHFLDNLRAMFRPSADWGPVDGEDKARWKAYCTDNPLPNMRQIVAEELLCCGTAEQEVGKMGSGEGAAAMDTA